MSDAAIVSLILQSAVRSLLLGACVYALVKLVRLRDLSAETAIWLAVLIAALLMPALTALLPGMAWRLPIAVPYPVTNSAVTASPNSKPWLFAHGGMLTIAAYALIASFGLIRLGIGLALTLRLLASAEPITEPWIEGRDIRQCAAINAPLSAAHAILLPVDWRNWPPAKLQAVLAHEDCHVRRGDFFILLLASIHRAVFWFSPFAWWLQGRLGALAETASDKAAVGRIADAAEYAEILVDVARRIDDIFAGIPEKSLSAVGRSLALAAVLGLSFGLAAVHARASDGDPKPNRYLPSFQNKPQAHRATLRKATSSHAIARPSHARRSENADVALADSVAPPPKDAVSYDPRALLDAPEVTTFTAIVFEAGRGGSAVSADN
jgi:hypothetical protein